jgi:hypothetical protein
MLNILNNHFDLNKKLNPVQKMIFINALQAAVKLIQAEPKNVIEV